MRIALLLLTLALTACGGNAGPTETTPEVDLLAPTVLYPMNSGAVWAYDIDTGGPEPPALGIYRVTEATGDRRCVCTDATCSGG